MSESGSAMKYTGENRPMLLTTPLSDTLLIRSLSVQEGMSQLFHMTADVYSTNAEIDFDQIIGQKVSISLRTESGAGRFFNGIVSGFSQRESSNTVTSYEMIIVPWFWFLTQTKSCRIFDNQTVSEIFEEVFSDLEMDDFDFIARRNPLLEYCVQYRESDFNFCSRLMEEAGLSYYFEHAEKFHKLTITDAASAMPPCADNAIVSMEFDTNSGNASSSPGRISQFHMSRSFYTGKFALTDFNFEDPGKDEDPGKKLLTGALSATSVPGDERFEIFEYPGQFIKIEEGDELLKQHVQAAEQESIQVTATSQCPGFTPGHVFTLQGHQRGGYNRDYLITEVSHFISQDIGVVEFSDSFDYMNDLTCLPYGGDGEVPFVPAQRTPRPAIHGVQSATVVSPDGKEIDVDEFGRVCVKFPWDRSTDKMSCRIRVSQDRAGSDWGGMSFPHPGHEVLVGFMEGDPNRPVVVGRVYNAHNMPPLNPETCTRTITRDHGGNEIVMDGEGGNERITLSSPNGETRLNIGAGFDPDPGFDLTTLWGFARQVGEDASDLIHGNVTTEVKGDSSTLIVGKTDSTHVGLSNSTFVGNKTSVSLAATEEGYIGLKSSFFAGAQFNSTIGFIYSVNKGYTFTRSSLKETKESLTFESKVKTRFEVDSKGTIKLEAADKIEFVCGGSKITMEGDKITIKTPWLDFVAEDRILLKVNGGDVVNLPSGKVTIPKKKLDDGSIKST